jgi:chromosome segregation ATPase
MLFEKKLVALSRFSIQGVKFQKWKHICQVIKSSDTKKK